MRSKKLHELVFPVYKMGAFEEIYTSPLGHVMISTHKKVYTLDDTNSSEPSYAVRRIHLKGKGFDLYHLNKKINTFSNIINYPTGTYFIDAKGYIFKYKKDRKYYKLNCHKITKRVFDPSRGSMLFSKDLPYPVFFLGKLNLDYKYMGILDVEGGGLLYNVTEQPFNPTRRMI